MKNELEALAKMFLIASASSTDAVWKHCYDNVAKESVNNFKWGNKWYHENS